MAKHKCAVPSCNIKVKHGILMCAPHWRMVPRPEQNAVYRTWRAFLDGGSRPEYEAAVADAVAKVEAATP